MIVVHSALSNYDDRTLALTVRSLADSGWNVLMQTGVLKIGVEGTDDPDGELASLVLSHLAEDAPTFVVDGVVEDDEWKTMQYPDKEAP